MLKKKFDASIKNVNKYLLDDDQTDKSFWICYMIKIFTDFEQQLRDANMVREMKKSNLKLPAEGMFLFLNQSYIKHMNERGVKGMPDIKKMMALQKGYKMKK